MGNRREKKQLAQQREQARGELLGLLDALRASWTAFERAPDPATAEAAILEIGALRSRFGRDLRAAKALYE